MTAKADIRRNIQVILNKEGMTKIISVSSTPFWYRHIVLPTPVLSTVFLTEGEVPTTAVNDLYILVDVQYTFETAIFVYVTEDNNASSWYSSTLLDDFIEKEKAVALIISKGWEILEQVRAGEAVGDEGSLLTLVNSMESWVRQVDQDAEGHKKL